MTLEIAVMLGGGEVAVMRQSPEFQVLFERVLRQTVERVVSGGADGELGSAPAGETLSGQRALVLAGGSLYHADASDQAHAGLVVGVSMGAALAGDEATYRRAGRMIEPSWSWSVGIPVFLGADGRLTQVPPEPGQATGFLQIIGWPDSPTSLLVDISQPVEL